MYYLRIIFLGTKLRAQYGEVANLVRLSAR